MKRSNAYKGISIIVMVLGFAFSSLAQDVQGVYVYPKENQSSERMTKDKNVCYNWAEDQVTSNPTATEQTSKHKTEKDAGKGAVGGAVIGGLLGGGSGALKGGAIGGAAGGVHGHRRSNQAEDNANAQINEDFNNAYASCLLGKGYSVK